jgi:Protein phosphatase inhibitor
MEAKSTPAGAGGGTTTEVQAPAAAMAEAKPTTLTLRLRARKGVQWDEEVVDNENMGKKKSKRCVQTVQMAPPFTKYLC